MARNLQALASNNNNNLPHASTPDSSNTHTFTFTKPTNITSATLQDPTVAATVSFDPWGPVLSAKVLPPAAAVVDEFAESSARGSSATSEAGISERSGGGSDARSLQGGSEGGSERVVESLVGKWMVMIEELPRSDAMIDVSTMTATLHLTRRGMHRELGSVDLGAVKQA